MIYAFADYLLQFLPIAAGVCLMLIIRSLAVARDHITIRVPDEPAIIRADKIGAGAAEQPEWRGRAVVSERMRDSAFEREANDELLVNGLLPDTMSGESIRRQASAKLGMVDLHRFLEHDAESVSENCPKLTLFVLDRAEALERLVAFGGDSGVLLQYLAGYALKVAVL